jgi:hypothetical protein
LLRQSGESRQVFVLFAIQYAVAPCQKGTDFKIKMGAHKNLHVVVDRFTSQ